MKMKNKVLLFLMAVIMVLFVAGIRINTKAQECGADGCTIKGAHTHKYCDIEGCNIEGEHSHSYCDVDGCTIEGEHHHNYCNVDGCTIVGEHTHNDSTGHHNSGHGRNHHYSN